MSNAGRFFHCKVRRHAEILSALAVICKSAAPRSARETFYEKLVILQNPVLQQFLRQVVNKNCAMGIVHVFTNHIANAAADLVPISNQKFSLVIFKHSPNVGSAGFHYVLPLVSLVL
jgi:hypothetical protein